MQSYWNLTHCWSEWKLVQFLKTLNIVIHMDPGIPFLDIYQRNGNCVYTGLNVYTGVQLNSTQLLKGTINTYNLDELQKHWPKWKRPVLIGYLLYDFILMIFLKGPNYSNGEQIGVARVREGFTTKGEHRWVSGWWNCSASWCGGRYTDIYLGWNSWELYTQK